MSKLLNWDENGLVQAQNLLDPNREMTVVVLLSIRKILLFETDSDGFVLQVH